MNPETFSARPYQVELLNEIKKSNTILYLPTGSGKTYIATMLIKELGTSLNKPLGEGRKWTILVVQSVPLVAQHANNLRKHLPWNVGTFTGDMGVDYCSSEQWAQILNKCHIMVMTAQIYLNNLHRGYMNIKDANLIIIDECHHARASHPFSQIMSIYHDTFKYNQDSQPHILGLTATLINYNSKNVKEDLSKLQTTLNATIKTRHDKDIEIFSARPKELIKIYDENILDNELLSIIDCIEVFIHKIKMIKPPVKKESIIENEDIFYFESSKPFLVVLANYLLEIEFILKDSGVYAAYLATWHYIIEVEKKKKMSNNIDNNLVLSMMLSEITTIRKMLFDYMKKEDRKMKISSALLIKASPKLKKLVQILTDIKRSDNCLVFVDRRTTAKVLYHYIKDYICEQALHNHLACDYIVGTGIISSFDCTESIFKKQQNNEIIKKFNENIINVLITSEVLEEGVDIQTCNYVIRYDCPKNFPSYVQSKGRARSSESKFIVMVDNLLKYEQVIASYIKMESDIDKILGKNEIKDDNIEDNECNEFYKTKSATLSYDIAISIIMKYCCSLPHDCYTSLVPEWYIAENSINDEKKYKYKLLLPMNSAIKTPIDGVFCKNKKSAKKSAAYHACIELYEKNVLDENLLPISIVNKSVFDHAKWFPYWDEIDIEACKSKQKPGTHKMKRTVQIEKSSYLSGTYPQINKSSYLHIIHCVPKYQRLNKSKYQAFDEILKSNKEFGILTSKKLPSVSQFPLFLHFGDVDTHIKVNVARIEIEPKCYKQLEQFHTKLFLDVLGVKKFIVRSYDNEKNSYLIVPVYFSNGNYCVDWDIVNLDTLVETKVPTIKERESKFYENHLEKISIITPWYRNNLPTQRYVVTSVNYNMSPESPFPNGEYDTFGTYFKEKYDICVVNKKQPLIKVKSLGVSKINFLTPRKIAYKIDNRNEFIELFVPEFCIWHEFPSVYWWKTLMLPTILYRLSQLLLAEDLLSKINLYCNIRVNSTTKDAIEIDSFCGFYDVNKNIILPINDSLKYCKNCPDNLDDKYNSNDFPFDIERQKKITLLDVYNYHTLMYSNNYEIKENNYNSENKEVLTPIIKPKTDELLNTVLTEMNVLILTKNKPPILSPLIKQHPNQKIGPNQSDILKAITPPHANDMFNYERMETYGDSFLKFATSIALFDAFELENEGVLSEIKQKLVGNRNLCYVGHNLDIGSYIMVNAFEPSMDWIPPCFVVPKVVKDIIATCDMSSDVLHNIVIPRKDQYSGKLCDETWVGIETEMIKFCKISTVPVDETNNEDETPCIGHSQSDLLMGKQSVSDKVVADCVESLIGTYVYKYGVEMGFQVLHGLGILPKEYMFAYQPKQIQNYEANTNNVDYSHILPGYQTLENRIGYTFKHKYLLVQALTHPTYQTGSFECYQRLEFIGDAILDFLITTYIIEHCNYKTPGEITDIRSALVNNITFASLSIRIGLHRFMLAQSVKLTEAIGRFFDHQQKNNFKTGQEVLYVIEESNCLAAESVEVPKALGDLFESLIAAIYIDCNRDLNFVWNVCYKLMENEIKEFSVNIPKNPIRMLHESKFQPHFSKPPAAKDAIFKGLNTMIQLDVNINKKNLTIYGFGRNKKEAKVAAAKMALKSVNKSPTS